MVSVDFWVEGTADQKFLADVLKHWFNLSCSKKYIYRDEANQIVVKIQNLGGKNKFLADEISSLFAQNNLQGIKNVVILDADRFEVQCEHVENMKIELGIPFPYYLLPDHQNDGELENLLESIIHTQNKNIFECWDSYEACLKQHDNPTRPGNKYTIPAKKSKIYSYLEVLLGETDAEKELAKDPKRDFTNANHWQLDHTTEPLKPLYDFLKTELEL